MPDLIIQKLCPLEGGYDHLAQNRLLLLQIRKLLLKVPVFFLLWYHAHFESAVKGLDQGSGCLCDLLVDVVDLGLHGVEFLPEKLYQLMVLLQVPVSLASEVLPSRREYVHHAEVASCVRGVLRVLLGRLELAHGFAYIIKYITSTHRLGKHHLNYSCNTSEGKSKQIVCPDPLDLVSFSIGK